LCYHLYMKEILNSQEKQTLPQLNKETGVSVDYRNNYVALKTWLDNKGIYYLKNMIKENNIKFQKYEEYFSPSIYKDVITSENKETVTKIDKLINDFNEKTNKENLESFSLEDFNKIFDSLEFLIIGHK
jgi:hypothetical protein